MKMFLLIGSTVTAMSLGMAAQTASTPQGVAPAAPSAVTITLPGAIAREYKDVKSLWTRTAAAMPAEAYSFKPAPEMRTFVAGIGHIVASNISQCGSLLGRKHALSGVDLEKTLTTKEDTVKAVADGFAFCDDFFLSLTDATPLADTFVAMNGRSNGQPVAFKVSNAASAVKFLEHNNEMYGYLAVYLRLKGIVPPSSVPTAPIKSGPEDPQ